MSNSSKSFKRTATSDLIALLDSGTLSRLDANSVVLELERRADAEPEAPKAPTLELAVTGKGGVSHWAFSDEDTTLCGKGSIRYRSTYVRDGVQHGASCFRCTKSRRRP